MSPDHRDRVPRRQACGPIRQRVRSILDAVREPVRRLPTPVAAGALALFAFIAGIHVATASESLDDRARSLRSELQQERQQVRQLEDRLVALRLNAGRLQTIHRYSATYSIGTDLAAMIHDVALEEGVDPALAFRLVSVESSFRRHVRSQKGAIGYTQIKPSTARWLDPSVTDGELYDPKTNLRLGFRYLRLLLDRYEGNRRIALLAYNQGPSRVGAQLAMGRDPANGYARSILSSAQ